MTGAALGARPRSTRRPVGTGQLLADQLVFTVRDLWRSRIVFVFTFLFPLTWLVLLGVMAGNDTVDEATGVRIMQYVTPTAAVMGALFATFPTVATSLALAREEGVLKRVRGTPLPAWMYLAGRIGGAVVFAAASVLTMLVVGVLAYDVQILWRTVLAAAVTMVVAIACFAALGLAVAAVAPSAGLAQAVSIAVVVGLSFFSGLYTIGDLPAWMERIASVFPLQGFNDAVRQQFDPYVPGTGWDAPALALMGAWGLLGAVVAARAFRWDADPARSARRRPERGTGEQRSAGSHPRVGGAVGTVAATTTGRPHAAELLVQQVRWAMRAAWRDPGWVFFAVAMPVGLSAFLVTVSPADATTPGGVPLALYSAAGMITWGAAVTAVVNMPEAVSAARDRGVLKRLGGTPLRWSLYLAGRAVAVLAIAGVTAALVLVVGVTLLGLEVAWTGLPLAVGVLLLGTASLAACGFALAAVLPSSKAVAAVGLAVLLPVSFVSDVFGMGQTPEWLGTVGAFFPLKHLANSLTAALDSAGPSLRWTAVAVLFAWLIAAGVLAVRRFDRSGRPELREHRRSGSA